MGFLEKIFGSKSKREVKKMQPDADAIVARSSELEKLSDPELKAKTAEFRQKLDNGASLDDILYDAFAVAREVAWRTLKMRHYPVQLIGGIVLHNGKIAEMRTGEGKTLTATAPVYLNALEGKGVHVVTVNDYLASRDAEWMGQIYRFLGLDVGVIVHGLKDYERQRAYRADITYGQNSEFGFDYLRDNMKMTPDRMVQRRLRYALVDEVDSILIDEARTPLIISGPSEQSADLYETVDKIVPRLKRDIDYTVDEKAHGVHLTDAGVERVEKLLGVDNLFDPKNIKTTHHVNQALRAHTLYKRDVNYVIKESKVVIVDEHTGRMMPGRRWSDGLHQAIEAKENVTVEEENQTLATVTYQNFFRMYDKLAGMTGTADTEAAEFHHIYKLDVVVIPTNMPLIREDHPDLVYKNEKGKFKAVFEEIIDSHERGQPVLVGTTSVEKSEVIAKLLRKRKVGFEVLNAKQHEREAHIVAQAGRKGAITISTNMAGRGTDIILGGNAEHLSQQMLVERCAEEEREPEPGELQQLRSQLEARSTGEREEVLAAGGLKIIGTERHESRRIDNQLRGRAGRQGDPGASRFYLSLDDDLMRIFAGDKVAALMERLGMEEDVPIEHSWVTKAIENAQKRVEGQNFDSRKNTLEYDDVMNEQRKTIYAMRKQILLGRYVPIAIKGDEKEQKTFEELLDEAPKTSGDWTVDKLAGEVREHIEILVMAGYKLEADMRARADEAAPEPELFEEPPAWRQLRSEVWRTTGAFAADTRKHFDKHADAVLAVMAADDDSTRSVPYRDEVIEDPDRGEDILAAAKGLIDYLCEDVAASLIQQRERLYDLCDGLIGGMVASHCPENLAVDEWDLEGLAQAFAEQFNVLVKLGKKGATQEKIAEKLWKTVAKRLEEREAELTRPWLLYFGRHFYLEEIDDQWIEHLKIMAHLREGIYLRGYGQKDPKKEYKKEGFELFAEMMDRIQVNAAKKIFHVQLRHENAEIPSMQRRARPTVESHPDAGDDETSSAYGDAADGGKAAGGKQKTVRRDKPKVGRNDPCPCGSGKKYKKCHGKAGAEQPTA
jgi:preprotein translocase subunit SecA